MSGVKQLTSRIAYGTTFFAFHRLYEEKKEDEKGEIWGAFGKKFELNHQRAFSPAAYLNRQCRKVLIRLSYLEH